MTRLSAFAMRTPSPCMPRASAFSSSASTTRWRWFPWTEKWHRRKPKRSRPREKHREIGTKQRRERKFQTWGRSRHVTCTGEGGASAGRLRCGTLRSLRGADLPRRRLCFLRPPQVGRCNCICFGFVFAPAIPPPPPPHARLNLARGQILPRGSDTHQDGRRRVDPNDPARSRYIESRPRSPSPEEIPRRNE